MIINFFPGQEIHLLLNNPVIKYLENRYIDATCKLIHLISYEDPGENVLEISKNVLGDKKQ